MPTLDLERDDRHEEEQLERAFERNQRKRCQCSLLDMPGTCMGPANCPMCQMDEEEDDD